MVEEPVPEDEMTRARDYTVGNFRLSLETTMALAHLTGESLLTEGEIEEVDEVVARLQAITADDVQKLAQRLFRRDNIALALVGPQASPDLLEKALVG
jgi:predicted Zn-dependent peptidase